jgi:hypothetical protein
MLASRVIKNVKESTPEYYEKFSYLVATPFTFKDLKPLINEGIFYSNSNDLSQFENSSFNEEFSDECYSLLIGSDNENNEKCKSTDECLEYYLEESASGRFKSFIKNNL